MPEPNVPLKAEELWENIEIYGEKDVWRLEDYLMVIIAPFCCISALLWTVSHPHVATGFSTV